MRSFTLSIISASLCAAAPMSVNVGGVAVSLDRYQGSATVSASRVEKFKLQVQVERKGETQPLNVRVELPASGSLTWPAADVEVRDAEGRALLVQRSGIEWEKLLIALPEGVSSCVVQAVEPTGGWPKTTSEKERVITDAASGTQVSIARWPEGRTAALSIRFDDSHPTHLSKAIPILRDYRFKGTFMVNPGPKEPGSRQNYSFETQHTEWEAVMKQGDMELANHSAHHRGAKGDDDMDAEIGTAAEAIWKLTPGKSKLMALNLGGGTRWETSRTLRSYLHQYHQFDASSGSLGMDDSYGGRVEAFRKALETHLARGLWCRIHFHYIGEGLSSSEAHFRAALDIARQHQDKLWIAGMADIYKYQTERNAAKITLVKSDPKSLIFRLDSMTDTTLYDQPLALEATIPAAWAASKVVIKDSNGQSLPATVTGAMLRCNVPPREGTYSILSDS